MLSTWHSFSQDTVLQRFKDVANMIKMSIFPRSPSFHVVLSRSYFIVVFTINSYYYRQALGTVLYKFHHGNQRILSLNIENGGGLAKLMIISDFIIDFHIFSLRNVS